MRVWSIGGMIVTGQGLPHCHSVRHKSHIEFGYRYSSLQTASFFIHYRRTIISSITVIRICACVCMCRRLSVIDLMLMSAFLWDVTPRHCVILTFRDDVVISPSWAEKPQYSLEDETSTLSRNVRFQSPSDGA
jgi:hypothetical protein